MTSPHDLWPLIEAMTLAEHPASANLLQAALRSPWEQKTGAKLKIPIHPELRRIIDAAAITGMKVLLVTRYGEAFTAKGFGNWFLRAATGSGVRTPATTSSP